MSKNELSSKIAKSMDSRKSMQDVFDFFSDPKNMELGGAIQSVKRVQMDGIPSTIFWQESQG